MSHFLNAVQAHWHCVCTAFLIRLTPGDIYCPRLLHVVTAR